MSKLFGGLLNLEGRVPSWISWVRNFFSWVFRRSNFFSCGYFVGPIIFSSRYFVGPKFFIVGISWVQNFSRGHFVGSKVFLVFLGYNFFSRANFVIQRFSVVGCVRKSDRKQKCINTSQTTYSIQNWFQQLSVLFMLEVTSSTKLVALLSSFQSY